MAGEADNVSSVSASACHIGGPIYVNPGELALVYGIGKLPERSTKESRTGQYRCVVGKSQVQTTFAAKCSSFLNLIEPSKRSANYLRSTSIPCELESANYLDSMHATRTRYRTLT